MCHVLIIEDDALVALELQTLLRERGATSFAFAETEAEAVAEARLRPPELITSDVKLRVGMGPRAVQTIHAELGPVPVIFITGTPELCEPCEPPGLVLSKPFLEPALADAFRALAPHPGAA